MRLGFYNMFLFVFCPNVDVYDTLPYLRSNDSLVHYRGCVIELSLILVSQKFSNAEVGKLPPDCIPFFSAIPHSDTQHIVRLDIAVEDTLTV